MEILLLLIVSISNIVCFTIGARVGQKVSKGEPIELPNPIETVRENNNRKKVQKEQNRRDTILHNIEVYDGTSKGQREVPKG
jgi:hypothetical protein